MESKTELRLLVRRMRAAIGADARAARSCALMARVLALPHVASARTLLAYEAVGSEVETAELIKACWAQGKAVALPHIQEAGRFEMRLVCDAQEMESGPHGIPHPRAQVCPLWRPDPSDVVLVPGVAFTAEGLRLGQGGGYYDRFLAQHPALWRIGVAFAEQMVASLPVEAHDARMNEVVAG
jgi:5-formyltetrahydrofolate cyclo-ligase